MVVVALLLQLLQAGLSDWLRHKLEAYFALLWGNVEEPVLLIEAPAHDLDLSDLPVAALRAIGVKSQAVLGFSGLHNPHGKIGDFIFELLLL